jgi:hypothetical protein
MIKEKYIDDLKEIKEMMNRSSKFISLSGLSGIAAGSIALIGAYIANKTIYANQDYFEFRRAILTNETLINLSLLAIGTLVLGLLSALYFTSKKAKKISQPLWDQKTKKLLTHLFIPLISGGLLCIILLFKGYIAILAPFTLIFYGLALVNASHYTLREIRSLGILEIILGLFAVQFIGYGLLFWAIGFGVLHIVYGVIMYIKYGS